MPYIPTERRDEIDNELTQQGAGWQPSNAGDLNWLVTTFIDNMLNEKGIRYAHINEMIGALECCKLELYRRIASPYEDQVKEKNGDAYYSQLPAMGSDY